MRAIGIVALALAVCVSATLLGRWQYHRHEARAADIAALAAATEHAPAPLADVIPVGTTTLPADATWRVVLVSGHFASAEPTWLRNRPVASTPAVHALGWFLTDDGRALVVNAGWTDAREAARPTLPTTPLTLTVTLRPLEADNGQRDAGATRIAHEQVSEAPAPPVPAYGVLIQACDPCGPIDGLAPTPLPTLALGPHLSYAWQWWLLAAGSIVFAVILLRQNGEPEATPVPREQRAKRAGAGPSDEEIEDAL